MSRIRSRNNKSTELRLRSILRANKLNGWRRHQPLPGAPDFAFGSAKLAVFVDGCFWHGCPKCYKAPGKNAAFWAEKVAYNRRRDRHIARTLRSRDWSVIRIWEHSLKNPDAVVARIRLVLCRSRRRQGILAPLRFWTEGVHLRHLN